MSCSWTCRADWSARSRRAITASPLAAAARRIDRRWVASCVGQYQPRARARPRDGPQPRAPPRSGRGAARRPGQRAQMPLGEVGSVTPARPRGRHDRASFSISRRSAPEEPAVSSAISARSTARERAPRACTRKMARRPSALGSSMLTWREKRLGRSSAGSSTSSRFVAPTHTSRSLPVKPSISMRSWLSVCSYSSFPLLKLRRRCAAAAERVELVDEDDRPPSAFRPRVKSLTHTRGAHAHVALDELGARSGEEVDPGLGGERLGEQRLAGAGRAVQEHAGRHAGADAREALRVLQELDELLHLLDHLVAAGDVAEHDRGTGLFGHLRVGAQRVAPAARAARGIAAAPEGHDQQHEREEDQPQQGDAMKPEPDPPSDGAMSTAAPDSARRSARSWVRG